MPSPFVRSLSLLVVALAVAILSPPAVAAVHPAGSTLRVGPTQVHATIGAALAVAVDGDLILVDPGTYPAFTVNGLEVTIRSSAGAASPFVVTQGASSPGIEVRNLLVTQTVSILHAIVPFANGNSPAVLLDQCIGSVRLHDVQIDLTTNLVNATARAALEAVSCACVWAEDLRIAGVASRTGNTTSLFGAPIPNNGGLNGLLLQDSHATLDFAVVHAFDNSTFIGGASWGGDALRLLGTSRLWLVRQAGAAPPGQLRAGNGGTFGGSCLHGVAHTGVVAACGATAFSPGAGSLPANRGGLYAIDGDRGIVQTTPSLVERAVALCLFQSVGSVSLPTASLSVGSSTPLTVSSLTPRSYFVVLSDTTSCLPGPSGSQQLFDLAVGATELWFFGAITTGPQTHIVNVPNLAALIGSEFVFQGVLSPPAGLPNLGLTLTLPAMAVIVP